MLDEELGQAVWMRQTFLQLSQEVAAMEERDGGQTGDVVTCQKQIVVALTEMSWSRTDHTALTHSLCQS